VRELNGDSAETVGDEEHSEEGDAEQSGNRTSADCWGDDHGIDVVRLPSDERHLGQFFGAEPQLARSA
jgi:hypothetical protein